MKNKTAFYFLALIPCLVFITCGKREITRHAHGKVVDRFDGTPVPHATVFIVDHKEKYFPQWEDILGSAETNADGEFDLTYTTNKSATDEAYAKSAFYFDDDVCEVDKYSRKDVTLFITPLAHMSVEIEIQDTAIREVFFECGKPWQRAGKFFCPKYDTDTARVYIRL
jgi:hypothetical protein